MGLITLIYFRTFWLLSWTLSKRYDIGDENEVQMVKINVQLLIK